MTEPLTTALKRVAEPAEVKTVLGLLQTSKPEIARALPAGVEIERFERIVRTEIRRTPKLLDCDPHSLLGAVMWAAQLGLEPGPLQHVHLIPHKREVVFVIGYRGYVELAYRSGQVKDVAAALVHEGDRFEYQYGTQPRLVHVPEGPAGEREIVAAWACARLRSGGAPFRVIYEDDWEKARKASQLGSKNAGPWHDDRAAMILKTAYRRLEPQLPKSPLVVAALVRDEQVAPPVEETDTEPVGDESAEA